MPIVIVDRQKDLYALASGLLLAKASRAATARAAEAIREANPGLLLDKLEPGMVLAVPDLPQARASTGDLVSSATDGVVSKLHDQLDGLLRAQRESLETMKAELEVSSAALSAPELRSASRDPDFKAVILELRRSVAEDSKALESQDETLRTAVQEWSDQIETLDKLAAGKVT